jgi:hypothetical protein
MDQFSNADISIGVYRGRVDTQRVLAASFAWLEQIARQLSANLRKANTEAAAYKG